MNKKHLFGVVLLSLLVAAVLPVLAGGLPGDNISIDIKPGSYPNSVNLDSSGVIPVAILSTDDFDAATVLLDDPYHPIILQGVGVVALRGKSQKSMARLEDVDGDGDLDLLLQMETESLSTANFQDGYATLRAYAETASGDYDVLIGSDEINIVPPE